MIGLLAFLAGGWAVVMGVSPLLQVRRMHQRRSSADVSIGYLLILFPGFVLWICYGSAIGDLALIITNIVALLVCSFTIGYAIKLRHPEEAGLSAGPATREGLLLGRAQPAAQHLE